MDVIPVIPEEGLKDTVALLVLLLSLPPVLSTVALFLFILTSSSKTFTSKIFNNLYKSNSRAKLTSTSSTTTPSSEQNHRSLILISLLDLFLCVVIKFSIPNLNKLIFVLANAILATSLTGKRNNFRNTILSCFTIIFIDYSLKLVLRYLHSYYAIEIVANSNNLFPYLSRLNSNNVLLFGQYLGSYSSAISYSVNFSNLILSIHVLLMGFSTVFKNNFISKNINQLSSSQEFSGNTIPFSSFLLRKEKDEKKIKIVEVDVSNMDIGQYQLPTNENESIPAAYPTEEKPDPFNQISTNNIVNENFQVFCKTSFSKPKNSIKAIQPLWSLFATIKAMNSRKLIYSGEEPLHEDGNNSLILSDYSNKVYDEFKFSNYVHDSSDNGNIKIFIEYIGQTLICFNLKNFNSKLQNVKMIVRVNGVIWYQVSKGVFNDYQEIFVISGLTPLSQYDIQFILQDNEQDKKFLVNDLIVSTIGADGLDISTTNTINSKAILSPLSTLQESLITTNDNLNKERVKLKKNRKEMSKKVASYKQDIETLKKIVNNSDKNDEKNYKKILSLRALLKQAEEEITKVNDELSVVEAKEMEITELYAIEKRRFDLHLRNFQNLHNAHQNKINEKKAILGETNTELEALISKNESKLNKYEKLGAEISKFSTDLNNLLDNEITLKLKLRNERMEKRKLALNEFKHEIKKLEDDVMELTAENENLRVESFYR